jgi:hypothetical protein
MYLRGSLIIGIISELGSRSLYENRIWMYGIQGILQRKRSL